MNTKGAILLLIDVPEFTNVGFDQNSYIIKNAKFYGFRQVVPGAHLLYTRAGNKYETEYGPTMGHFLYLKENEIEVRKWNFELEELEKIEDEEILERYKIGIRNYDFDTGLIPYEMQKYKTWQILTKYITKNEIIDKISPMHNEAISIINEKDLIDLENPKTQAEYNLVKQLKDSISKVKKTKNCYYMEIPRLLKSKDLSVNELTSGNMDKSKLLDMIIKEKYNNRYEMFLGEYQYAYLAFLLCQSMEGFEQWKKMTIIVLDCTEALFYKHLKLFFKNYIEILYNQLLIQNEDETLDIIIEDDFILNNNSFIKKGIVNFVYNIKEEEEEVLDVEIKEKLGDLKRMIKEKWKINKECNDDEEEPVIVIIE